MFSTLTCVLINHFHFQIHIVTDGSFQGVVTEDYYAGAGLSASPGKDKEKKIHKFTFFRRADAGFRVINLS
jgi:hypothetical protein